MGRRKSKRKPPPKSKNIEALDTMFTCPFCNHEKSCEVRMDKSKNAARIQCTICLEDFQATINFLSEPIGKGPFNSHLYNGLVHLYTPQPHYKLTSERRSKWTPPPDVYNEWIDACEAVNS